MASNLFSQAPSKNYYCPECGHREILKPVPRGIYCVPCSRKGKKVMME